MSNYRRLLEQDYPEDSELIKKIGITINSSFEEIYNALNNRLTVKENLSATIASFAVTVDAFGVPKNKTQFKLLNGQTNVEGLILIDASGTTNPNLLPSSGIFVSFVRDSNNIIIKNIKGLIPDNSYTLKVLVLG